MALFNESVKKIINEIDNKDIIHYEDLKSDYVNGPVYVYHMTGKANLKGGIMKSGWESWYNAWNSYGPGIYTCVLPSFDPNARVMTGGLGSKPNPNRDYERSYIYGLPKDHPKHGTVAGVMLLCQTLRPNPFRSFLIFDEKMARTIYKSHWRIKDQLSLILGKKFNEIMTRSEKLRTLCYYGDKADNFFKDNDTTDDFSKQAYSQLYYRGVGAGIADAACEDPEVNRAIRGLIFHGPGDGYVAIFRDYNAIKPIAVSTDLGHTFKPIETEHEFDKYQTNNIDIRSQLGLDRFYFPKSNTIKGEYLKTLKVPFKYLGDTFYGDFAIAGDTDNPIIKVYKDILYVSTDNEKDWRWNYIYKPYLTKSADYNDLLISNIWFDSISAVWDDDVTTVSKNGQLYYIKQEGENFYLYNNNSQLIGDLKEITDDDLVPNEDPNTPKDTDNEEDDFDIDSFNF